ncbi:unnamed protein product [Caenorhabditis angaria]|uniref:C2H2-type domain-containing protein n=1 Tax=Caenorhabditis angaria TaxID=860376 RepID=A0A9P1ITG0_9PELO|nr:unnamed protein product [Caenorhabditis angaria]
MVLIRNKIRNLEMNETTHQNGFSSKDLLNLDDKQKALLEQFLIQANSSMQVKNGIDDIASRLKNGSSSGGNLIAGSIASSSTNSPKEPQFISNNSPNMNLNCVECGVKKSTSEDMETHLKTEHLNWLPFQCPICLVERASDAQMREHLHATHNKNMNKFIYVDNVGAKRQLQILMDKCFARNVAKRINASPNSPKTCRGSNQSSGRNTATSNDSTPSIKEKEKQQAQVAADFLKLLDFSVSDIATPKSKQNGTSRGHKRPFDSIPSGSATVDIVPVSDATLDGIVAKASKINGENEENELQPTFSLDDLNLDGNSALASLFGANNKLNLDDLSNEQNDAFDDPLDALNPISVLDNVAALFGSTPNTIESSETKKITSSVSKKRVLGECSKCQKPVTAGARQMHMFFHLAKDENIYRFKCKHEGCTIEHYRKDQMENHQSKMHGRIDPDMMEDRSLELFQKCQELNHELFVAHRAGGASRSNLLSWSPDLQDLSMELLGTKNGTIPGPTAAKAEIAYAAQQLANAKKNANKAAKSSSISTSASSNNVSTNGFLPLKLVPDEDHPLQCRLCGKTMQNRIRGFHILWHMAKDKGINRYTCKQCDFGHDRSQSVQVHGKKEHGSDDCVEDRIGEYQDDVKEMSEACFGISSLFAQESKRKNKIPAANVQRENESGDASPLTLIDEEAELEADVLLETLQDFIDLPKIEKTEENLEEDVEETENEEEIEEDGEEEEEQVTGSARRKRKISRFNFRGKKSKKQKEVAAVTRNISILIGGTQFCRKKVNEFSYCQICSKLVANKMPEHAYSHMKAELFQCPVCEVGHQCRDMLTKHIKDMHPTNTQKIIDNRLIHVADIKKSIKECFPAFFIDHPLPTREDLEKLGESTKNLIDLKNFGIEKYLENCEE